MKWGKILTLWSLALVACWAAETLLYQVFHTYMPIKGQDLSWRGAMNESLHDFGPLFIGYTLGPFIALCIPSVRRRILANTPAELSKDNKEDR